MTTLGLDSPCHVTSSLDHMTLHYIIMMSLQVEHIIREDYMVEAMEVVELYCDLLLARFGMMEQMS